MLVSVTCGPLGLLSYVIADNKARKPEVGRQNVSVSSSGKPVHESSSDENKESAVEPKQSISDGRPKEGWLPFKIFIYIVYWWQLVTNLLLWRCSQ